MSVCVRRCPCTLKAWQQPSIKALIHDSITENYQKPSTNTLCFWAFLRLQKGRDKSYVLRSFADRQQDFRRPNTNTAAPNSIGRWSVLFGTSRKVMECCPVVFWCFPRWGEVKRVNFWRPQEMTLYHGGLYQAHELCLLLHWLSFPLLLPCIRIVWRLHTAIMIVGTERFLNSQTYIGNSSSFGVTRKIQRTTTSQSVMAFLNPSTSEEDLVEIHGWRGRKRRQNSPWSGRACIFWKEERT